MVFEGSVENTERPKPHQESPGAHGSPQECFPNKDNLVSIKIAPDGEDERLYWALEEGGLACNGADGSGIAADMLREHLLTLGERLESKSARVNTDCSTWISLIRDALFCWGFLEGTWAAADWPVKEGVDCALGRLLFALRIYSLEDDEREWRSRAKELHRLAGMMRELSAPGRLYSQWSENPPPVEFVPFSPGAEFVVNESDLLEAVHTATGRGVDLNQLEVGVVEYCGFDLAESVRGPLKARHLEAS